MEWVAETNSGAMPDGENLDGLSQLELHISSRLLETHKQPLRPQT